MVIAIHKVRMSITGTIVNIVAKRKSLKNILYEKKRKIGN